jgi:hypothetical protein
MIRLTLPERALGVVLAILLAVNSGCGAALRTTTIAPREQPWCITVVRTDGEHITACTERRVTCAMARAFAATWGSRVSLAGIDAACVYNGPGDP